MKPTEIHDLSGYLERLEDYQHAGKTIAAGRLGYRITQRFAHEYFGHIPRSGFRVPRRHALPGRAGCRTLRRKHHHHTDTQRRIAKAYFREVPPPLPPALRALLEIMAQDTVNDTRLRDLEFRASLSPPTSSPAIASGTHRFRRRQQPSGKTAST